MNALRRLLLLAVVVSAAAPTGHAQERNPLTKVEARLRAIYVIQITEALVDRLIELGKRFDYMTYPNRDHGLSEGPGSTLHVRSLIARYLIENLPPGPRPAASP